MKFECDLLKVRVEKREDGTFLKVVEIDPIKFLKEKRIPCSKNCKPCLGVVNARELYEKGWRSD